MRNLDDVTPNLLAFLAAFGATVVSIPLLRRVAHVRRLVDDAIDDPLKIHKAPIPFVGGLGILAGFLLGVSIAVSWGSLPRGAAVLVACAAAAVAILGLADDIHSVPPVVRVVVEAAVAIGLCAAGVRIGAFGTAEHVASTAVAIIVVAIGAFYVVGAINAINMLDGMDGLAGGAVAISSLGFAVVGTAQAQPLVAAMSIALAGGVGAFLVYNFNPASVFMGDNGSYFLGLVIGWLAIVVTLADGSIHGAVGGVLIVGAPVFDAAFAITRRVVRGVSPFEGDRSHFYDLLLSRGMSVRTVAATCYAIQVVLVAIGVALLVS